MDFSRYRAQTSLTVGKLFLPSLRMKGGVLVLRARGILTTKIGSFSKAYRRWLVRFAMVLLSCGSMVNAQSPIPAETGSETSIEGSSPPYANNSPQETQELAPRAAAKPGSIVGTILDQSGAVSVGTVVRLTSEDKSFSRDVVSGDNGQFSFSNVPPGHFNLSINSTGFGNQSFAGELAPEQTFLVPPIVLSIATVVTAVDVNVSVNPVEVAAEEVKEQEHQRVLGFIPNFYVTYRADAAPLTTKLKFQLAWKSSTDPVTILGTAFLAGVQQTGDQYSEFGQGAQGYGKRFGAAYAGVFASTFLSGAVFPSLLKQDPRYFYKGTGSTRSRIWRVAGIFQEFVARKLTKRSKGQSPEHTDSTDVLATQHNSVPWPKKP